jgi:hypothetical protein
MFHRLELTMKLTTIVNVTLSAAICALVIAGKPSPALADEGGLSFWLPGTFGSLSATPATPGWSWATFYITPMSLPLRARSSRAAGGSTSALAAVATSSDSGRHTSSRHLFLAPSYR